MDEKRLEFPCTKNCLVYASCQELCTPYRDYIQEAFRERKYGCFKIIPPPPKQIQELTKLLNRVRSPNYEATYYTDADMFVVYEETYEITDGEHYVLTPILTIKNVRMREDLMSHEYFPEELK